MINCALGGRDVRSWPNSSPGRAEPFSTFRMLTALLKVACIWLSFWSSKVVYGRVSRVDVSEPTAVAPGR